MYHPKQNKTNKKKGGGGVGSKRICSLKILENQSYLDSMSPNLDLADIKPILL